MNSEMNEKTSTYGAQDIQVLEGLEAVRRRPGMYIGSTDVRGLHHLVFEVVDNSIDEALAGVCNYIQIAIHPDHTVTVEDNGRGIPIGPHPTQKIQGKSMDALEVVMTILHAGGKFGGGGYKVASGLHGVGVSAVNALSEWMEVQVRRDGSLYRQRYDRGHAGNTGGAGREGRGNWHKDYVPSRFGDFQTELDYKFEALAQRFREMAFLTRGLKISLYGRAR